MTDAELIVASRRDPGAFRVLYDRWAEKLLAYFYRRVLDAEVAADLLAETFAVAFERRGRYRDTGQPGAAWLFGIASKELSHWFRHQQVERRAIRRLGITVPELDDESIARIETLADLDTQRAALGAAMARMTDRERDAVWLRVVDELGYTEIAARLGCTEDAARSRVHRGLARLSTLLEDGSLPAGAATPLVACVRPDVAKVVVIAGGRGDCERHQLDPLPGGYDPARAKVAKLERDLRAIEGSAACITPEVLARRVQALLDRGGWTGWQATPRPDLSEGPCGHVLSRSEGGRRTLELVPNSRQLLVIGEAPAGTVEPLFRLSEALAEESVARCFSAQALQARVRQRLAPMGRPVSFRVAEALPGKYAGVGANSDAGARYAAGCAILEKIAPEPDGRGLVALIHRKR